MKPIYEIYLAEKSNLTRALFVREKMQERMPEFEVIVFCDPEYKYTKTKIIYPTATFWGWWYNLWNS